MKHETESKKEQMSIVLKFVDKNRFIRERFVNVRHLKDTVASTLIDFSWLGLQHQRKL